MTSINLRDYYPWYIEDQFVEVSDEVAEELQSDKLYEAAHRRRIKRNKAQYSLDAEDGIEYSACVSEPTPQELLERMETFERLCRALNSLPEAQGRRVRRDFLLRGGRAINTNTGSGVGPSRIKRIFQRWMFSWKREKA